MKPIKTWVSMDDNVIGVFEDGHKFVALWRFPDDDPNKWDSWNSFGGSVGYSDASFDTMEEAFSFVDKGLREELKNPEVWLDMVAVK